MTYELTKNNVTLYYPDGTESIMAAGSKIEIIDFKYSGHKELAYLQDGSYIISRVGQNDPIITPIKKKGKKDGT